MLKQQPVLGAPIEGEVLHILGCWCGASLSEESELNSSCGVRTVTIHIGTGMLIVAAKAPNETSKFKLLTHSIRTEQAI